MFLTALAPNLLAAELVQKSVNVQIGRMPWLIGFLPAGPLLLLTLPLVVYWIYPPEVKRNDEVTGWADRELRGMGPLRAREIGRPSWWLRRSASGFLAGSSSMPPWWPWPWSA